MRLLKWIKQVEAMRELSKKLRRAIDFMASVSLASKLKVLLMAIRATLIMVDVKSSVSPYQRIKQTSVSKPGKFVNPSFFLSKYNNIFYLQKGVVAPTAKRLLQMA